MNSQIIFSFDKILKDAKGIFSHSEKRHRKHEKADADCPTEEVLLDYVYDDLTEAERKAVSKHIRHCEYCFAEVLKIEADQTEWEYMLDEDPNKALTEALGASGMEHLCSCLLGKESEVRSQESEARSQQPTANSQHLIAKWFKYLFQGDWQPAELLLSAAYRGATIEDTTMWRVKRAKVIEIEKEILLLLVQLTPQKEEDVEVSFQVYPSGGALYLPSGLQVEILDQTGSVLMKAESGREDDGMELTWIREQGDEFEVRIILGNMMINENL